MTGSQSRTDPNRKNGAAAAAAAALLYGALRGWNGPLTGAKIHFKHTPSAHSWPTWLPGPNGSRLTAGFCPEKADYCFGTILQPGQIGKPLPLATLVDWSIMHVKFFCYGPFPTSMKFLPSHFANLWPDWQGWPGPGRSGK